LFLHGQILLLKSLFTIVKAAKQNGSPFVPARETRAHGSTRMPAPARGIPEPTPNLRRAIVVADKTPKLLGHRCAKRQNCAPAGGFAVNAGNTAAAP
jgi:hypothetical protein